MGAGTPLRADRRDGRLADYLFRDGPSAYRVNQHILNISRYIYNYYV